MIAVICYSWGSQAHAVGGIAMGGYCAEHYQMDERGWHASGFGIGLRGV